MKDHEDGVRQETTMGNIINIPRGASWSVERIVLYICATICICILGGLAIGC